MAGRYNSDGSIYRKIRLKPEDRLNKQTHEYFEPHLKRLNLSREQVESQDLANLNQSLEAINDAIRNPDSFGTFKVSYPPIREGGGVANQSTSQIEVGILPILLERKKLILDRIKELSSQEKFERIRGLVQQVHDGDIKVEIEKELDAYEVENQEIKKEEANLEIAKEEEGLKAEMNRHEIALAKVEILERKSKIWRLFLERESASTILGGILLFIITICQLLAMFTNIETTQVVNNAFLLILGYFFGTTVSRTDQGSEKN